MTDDQSPLRFLNGPERRLLGPLVVRLFRTANPRFQRALETSGTEATARMACVNALRLYAIVLFTLGAACKLAGVGLLAYLFYVLAAAAMAWSFWCLYTVVRPEREFRRGHASPPGTA
ncbi:MAG: hypothetical protein ACLQBB_11675 [Solirubrobacteraceae bacterium]